MPQPNFFILYVDDPARSAAFYSTLLDLAPVEASPTFAMFALESGVMLALWSRHTVEPAARGQEQGGGGELAFAVGENARVDALHAEWNRRGLPIAQPPTAMDFGYTFVALDPDRHRLRVFAAAQGS
jgi:catechol 2,3-dioxygenase-like lactoylglutathione lyase family enzyme